jgi:hypothetical protein
VESLAGVEDLDSDEAAVFPLEDGGRVGAARRRAMTVSRPVSSWSPVRKM